MWHISVPIFVIVTKKKKFWLNLNQYRNAHHFTLDKAKKKFKTIVTPKLSNIPFIDKVRISYILYAPNERKRDVANVCSIVDKFFSDCLVEAGKLEDDDWQYLPLIAYGWGGVDKLNPRVDVIIEKI